MEINLSGTIYKINQHIHGTTMFILKKRRRFLEILNFYGARAILLLFCVHQDTESE